MNCISDTIFCYVIFILAAYPANRNLVIITLRVRNVHKSHNSFVYIPSPSHSFSLLSHNIKATILCIVNTISSLHGFIPSFFLSMFVCSLFLLILRILVHYFLFAFPFWTFHSSFLCSLSCYPLLLSFRTPLPPVSVCLSHPVTIGYPSP